MLMHADLILIRTISGDVRNNLMKNDEPKSIVVTDINKSFRVYSDKSHTFKDRVLFAKRNKYTINKVLSNVSFTCEKGEALGLIGHNGCGKSTTLKLLNRILYPDSGSIVMNGKISSLIELGAGFHPDMTGRENIYINATIFGLKKKEIDERLDTIIRFSELEKYIDNPVRTYSSGMYMRLAFAIAINVDADILLVDEILAVGDANFQRKCFDKLNEIKRQGTTIVIVSHSMDQIKSVCDQVIWLDNGVIREQGEASTVCDDYLIAMDDAANARHNEELKEMGLESSEDPNIAFPLREVSAQISPTARRKGNMKVRFKHLELLSAGETKNTFHFKDNVTIDFSTTAGNLSGNIVFNIVNKDGVVCSTFESYIFYAKHINICGLKNSKVVLHNLHLAAGNYHLDAFLFDDKGTLLDFIARSITFKSDTPASNGEGILATENEWELK